MRLAPAHGEPGVEIFVYGVTGGAFPARQHVEASRAIARLHRLDPERTLFAAAIRRSDRRRRLPQRRRRGGQRADAVRPRAGVRRPRCADRRAASGWCRGSSSSRSPTPTCRWPTRSHPICSTPSWSRPPDGETTLIVPDRSARDAIGVALARAASRRQRPDPPGRGGRRPPVDGQWRRPGLPAAARRRRSGDASIRASWSTRRGSIASPRSSSGIGRPRSPTPICSSPALIARHRGGPRRHCSRRST